MRITTALNRLLRLRGASVIDVSITPQAIIVTVRLRRRRRICSWCAQTGRHLQIHGRRVKRWRHLDLGSASSPRYASASPTAASNDSTAASA